MLRSITIFIASSTVIIFRARRHPGADSISARVVGMTRYMVLMVARRSKLSTILMPSMPTTGLMITGVLGGACCRHFGALSCGLPGRDDAVRSFAWLFRSLAALIADCKMGIICRLASGSGFGQPRLSIRRHDAGGIDGSTSGQGDERMRALSLMKKPLHAVDLDARWASPTSHHFAPPTIARPSLMP